MDEVKNGLESWFRVCRTCCIVCGFWETSFGISSVEYVTYLPMCAILIIKLEMSMCKIRALYEDLHILEECISTFSAYCVNCRNA